MRRASGRTDSGAGVRPDWRGSLARTNAAKRLAQLEGVGPLVATALGAAVGNAHQFKSGRELSSWLGPVPRQHSSGAKTVSLGISKRDPYLRTLLIHGHAGGAHCGRPKRSS